MCVNFETSIISFLVGEITGFILSTQSNEKRIIGLFIMFYSLVQLFEACMYFNTNDKTTLFSRLLLINLGLQGLVYFILVNFYFKVEPIYFMLFGIISLYIMYKAIVTNFNASTINPCMKWNFMENDTIKILGSMYIIMLIYMLTSQVQLFNNVGKLFIITYGVSLLLPYNSPSVWCLTSAIAAPVILFL